MKLCIVLLGVLATAFAADPNCLRACPMIYMPVCASNGKTYGNECEMGAAACVLNAVLKKVIEGPCPTVGTTPAPKTIDTKCLRICPMIWFPVCGSDGKTYGNTCEMKSSSCMAQTTITVAHQGPCKQ